MKHGEKLLVGKRVGEHVVRARVQQVRAVVCRRVRQDDEKRNARVLLAQCGNPLAGAGAAAVCDVARRQDGDIVNVLRNYDRIIGLRRLHPVKRNTLLLQRLLNQFTVGFVNQQNTHILYAPFGESLFIMKHQCGNFVWNRWKIIFPFSISD